jgi:hypothetical protein
VKVIRGILPAQTKRVHTSAQQSKRYPTHHAPCTTHHAPRTTHHAPRTTHHAPRTTHHAPRTTHHALLLVYGSLVRGGSRERQDEEWCVVRGRDARFVVRGAWCAVRGARCVVAIGRAWLWPPFNSQAI